MTRLFFVLLALLALGSCVPQDPHPYGPADPWGRPPNYYDEQRAYDRGYYEGRRDDHRRDDRRGRAYSDDCERNWRKCIDYCNDLDKRSHRATCTDGCNNDLNRCRGR